MVRRCSKKRYVGPRATTAVPSRAEPDEGGDHDHAAGVRDAARDGCGFARALETGKVRTITPGKWAILPMSRISWLGSRNALLVK